VEETSTNENDWRKRRRKERMRAIDDILDRDEEEQNGARRRLRAVAHIQFFNGSPHKTKFQFFVYI